ncbi:unnamed protein product [Protopolystoma xenopodis]|uniref:Uncharacterized protein n=1 Tax=Protopolystoma xenopodis TaxID=117903 RepID=A0A448WR57_9PLAT|nr:unnamed protein product [Protopolystoma xenopodis]
MLREEFVQCSSVLAQPRHELSSRRANEVDPISPTEDAHVERIVWAGQLQLILQETLGLAEVLLSDLPGYARFHKVCSFSCMMHFVNAT